MREARAGDCQRIAEIHVESWRNTYRGIMPDSFLDAMSTSRSRIGWDLALAETGDNKKIFVSEDEAGRITGFARFGPGRDPAMPFPGEIYAIYVDLPARGFGAGTELLKACARAASLSGWNGMYLWAATANAYARFYLKNGGSRHTEKTQKVAGTEIALTSFCWPDINAIFGQTINLPGERNRQNATEDTCH